MLPITIQFAVRVGLYLYIILTDSSKCSKSHNFVSICIIFTCADVE